MVGAANPVTGDGGVASRGFTQQLAQRFQPLFGDGGLPGAFPFAFGELIQHPAGFYQRPLVAFGNQQDVHRATWLPVFTTWLRCCATCCRLSIITSSASA